MASGDLLAILEPHAASTPTTNMATPDTRNNHPLLAYDATTEETAYWESVLPDNYDGGGLTVTVCWLAATATSGGVVWGSSIERQDTSLDFDADSFATEQLSATATTGATSGTPSYTTIAHTSGAAMDSLAVNEMFRIRIARKVGEVGDDMAGDAQVVRVFIRET